MRSQTSFDYQRVNPMCFAVLPLVEGQFSPVEVDLAGHLPLRFLARHLTSKRQGTISSIHWPFPSLALDESAREL